MSLVREHECSCKDTVARADGFKGGVFAWLGGGGGKSLPGCTWFPPWHQNRDAEESES